MIKYAGISEEDYERTIFKTYAGISAGGIGGISENAG